jgi:hypothetical protein
VNQALTTLMMWLTLLPLIQIVNKILQSLFGCFVAGMTDALMN